LLIPSNTWQDPAAYVAAAQRLAAAFEINYAKYASDRGAAAA
jgi:ATP-dependent phosphoenolpyruvate carboxykinase